MAHRPVATPPGPGQESVWTFPRPARVEATVASLKVMLGERVIAATTRGFRAIETSHPPSYYFPQADIDMTCLRPARNQSLCEWKGAARYFDLVLGDRVVPAAAWTYPDPAPAFAAIRDYVSFYPQRVDACFVNGERAVPQEGGFYGGWITGDLAGPFKGARGTEGW